MTRALPGLARRLLSAVEPWYNWGTINIDRMDTCQPNGDGVDYGDIRFFDLQWFGVHIGLQVGRVPPKGSR